MQTTAKSKIEEIATHTSPKFIRLAEEFVHGRVLAKDAREKLGVTQAVWSRLIHSLWPTVNKGSQEEINTAYLKCCEELNVYVNKYFHASIKPLPKSDRRNTNSRWVFSFTTKQKISECTDFLNGIPTFLIKDVKVDSRYCLRGSQNEHLTAAGILNKIRQQHMDIERVESRAKTLKKDGFEPLKGAFLFKSTSKALYIQSEYRGVKTSFMDLQHEKKFIENNFVKFNSIGQIKVLVLLEIIFTNTTMMPFVINDRSILKNDNGNPIELDLLSQFFEHPTLNHKVRLAVEYDGSKHHEKHDSLKNEYCSDFSNKILLLRISNKEDNIDFHHLLRLVREGLIKLGFPKGTFPQNQKKLYKEYKDRLSSLTERMEKELFYSVSKALEAFRDHTWINKPQNKKLSDSETIKLKCDKTGKVAEREPKFYLRTRGSQKRMGLCENCNAKELGSLHKRRMKSKRDKIQKQSKENLSSIDSRTMRCNHCLKEFKFRNLDEQRSHVSLGAPYCIYCYDTGSIPHENLEKKRLNDIHKAIHTIFNLTLHTLKKNGWKIDFSSLKQPRSNFNLNELLVNVHHPKKMISDTIALKELNQKMTDHTSKYGQYLPELSPLDGGTNLKLRKNRRELLSDVRAVLPNALLLHTNYSKSVTKNDPGYWIWCGHVFDNGFPHPPIFFKTHQLKSLTNSDCPCIFCAFEDSGSKKCMPTESITANLGFWAGVCNQINVPIEYYSPAKILNPKTGDAILPLLEGQQAKMVDTGIMNSNGRASHTYLCADKRHHDKPRTTTPGNIKRYNRKFCKRCFELCKHLKNNWTELLINSRPANNEEIKFVLNTVCLPVENGCKFDELGGFKLNERTLNRLFNWRAWD
ncbi:hypothetical protein [Shewanella marisflavi]|uniref:Uncharacterized protein n=1 Tax=Shewanella marisflavi TaxID=260364 RepID=A0AAC9U396_9GAMM|nr:hypothetical protein [Shewanella marisflavi]ASJ97681.1 hypothetical protein CFF01_14445 [Shewanella marisflavi]